MARKTLTQRDFDKLIAIAGSMKLALQATGVTSITVETHQGEDEGKIEMMSLEKIDDFLDEVFEIEVRE